MVGHVNVNFAAPSTDDLTENFSVSHTDDSSVVYSDRVFYVGFINVTILIGVILSFFLLSRCRAVKIAYDIRRQLHFREDVNQKPPESLSQQPFFVWRPWPLGSGLALLPVVGLDGVVAIRFALMCLQFCILFTPVAGTLAFLYHSGANARGKPDLLSFQISNQEGTVVQLVGVGAAWWFSVTLLYLLRVEYDNFCMLRLAYFTGEHLERTARMQSDYYQRTVMLERVPEKIQTNDQLKNVLENLFDDTVEHAILCDNVRPLKEAVAFCRCLEEDQEALSLARRTGRCLGILDVLFTYGPKRLSRRGFNLKGGCCGSTDGSEEGQEKQDAIAKVRDLYNELLNGIGGEVDGSSSRKGPPLPRSNTEHRMMQSLHFHLPEIPLPQRFKKSHAITGFKPIRSVSSESNDVIARQGDFWLRPCSCLRYCCSLLKQALGFILMRKSGKGRTGFVTFRSRKSQATALRMTLFQSSSSMKAERAPYPNGVVWENMPMTEGKTKVRTYVSAVFILLMLMLWSFVAALIQAVANIEFILIWLLAWMSRLLPNNPLHQAGIIDVTTHQTHLYTALNGYLTALTLTILLVVVPFLMRTWCRDYEGHKSKSVIMERSIKLCVLFNLTAMYVTAISGSIFQSGILTASDDITVTFTKVIIETAGKLDNVSGNMMCYILTKLGFRMAVYLCRPYVVFPFWLQGLANNVWKACRAKIARNPKAGENSCETGAKSEPLLQQQPQQQQQRPLQNPPHSVGSHFVHSSKSCNSGNGTEASLKEAPCYDWIVTDLLVILSLCTMYGIIAPLLVFVAMLFFWVYACMLRYNLIFVYTQEYDSGGQFFFPLVYMTTLSLQMSLIILLIYLFSIRKTPQDWTSRWLEPIMRFSLLLLILIVHIISRQLQKSYEPVCQTLSLQLAKELDSDSELQELKRGKSFQEPPYRDPVIPVAKAMAAVSTEECQTLASASTES